MSTYTRHNPQGKYKTAGKRHGHVYTQAQHEDVPGGRADGLDLPFPNNPVSHRRPLNPRIQDTLGLYDFEKISITKQPRGSLSLQEHHSNDIRETPGSQHPRKDSHSRELQMARAIHAKELMLQDKLRRVEEKIRQRFQRDSAGAPAGDDRGRGQAERGKATTRTRLHEQQGRDPVSSREMMQDRRQEDVKLLRKTQDQRNEDRMRNAREEGRARGKRRDLEVAQPQRQGCRETHEITIHEQEVSRQLNKSRWENVKELTRRKREGTRDNGIWGESGVKSWGRTEKAKEREQNTTSVDNKGWTREKKYRERTYKETYSSDDERNVPQMSQQKTSHRAATENHRSAGRKQCEEPVLPLVSIPSPPSRPWQGELRPTDTSLHLLPCRICNRTFASDRLKKHIQICEKVKQSHRQVFNSYSNRTKGSAIEEFWKTHSRPKTPELTKKNNLRQNHKTNTRNLHGCRLPTETSQSKQSK